MKMLSYLRRAFTRFLHEENGATAIEYALIVSMIAIGLMGAFSVIAGKLNTLFAFFTGFFA
jgi:pilus assembly protein Flp/PilA